MYRSAKTCAIARNGKTAVGAALAVALMVGCGPAVAEEPVNTGYFGGVAIMGYDPVAYFTEGLNPGDRQVLENVAAGVGLDRERARQILNSDEYATEVRAREQLYQNAGIHAVPAVILNDRYLIEGGQPVEAFERALRQAAQS